MSQVTGFWIQVAAKEHLENHVIFSKDTLVADNIRKAVLMAREFLFLGEGEIN